MKRATSVQFNASRVDIKFEKLQTQWLLIPCQFSNWMSSSQFQCHRDVINDTKVRIGANGGVGDAGGSHPTCRSHQFGTVNRSAISSEGVTAGARCATSGMQRGRRLTLKRRRIGRDSPRLQPRHFRLRRAQLRRIVVNPAQSGNPAGSCPDGAAIAHGHGWPGRCARIG